METIEINLYKFSELSEEAQEKALESLYDINTDYKWWQEHKSGAILEFIAINEGINEEDLCCECETYIHATNYDELTNQEYCKECRSWFYREDFKNSTCYDCAHKHKYSIDETIRCEKCKHEITSLWDKRSFVYNLNQHNIKDVICSDC